MLRFAARLARALGPLGVCGNAGLLVGMVTGGLLFLLDFLEGPLALTLVEALQFWAATAAFCWLMLIALFVALARWTFASVALPALVNSVLVSGLTIFACRVFSLYAWAWWVGILVGVLVGFLLCGLYRAASKE